jgi:hypothetical protein
MRISIKQSGYVALLAVLIVGAASLAVATALLLTAADSQRSTLVSQQSSQARNVAFACGEEALQQIHDNTSFTGTNNFSIGAGSCTYTVTNTGGQNRTITATGTVGTVVRKIQSTITIGTNITINSWQDTVGSYATIAHVQTNVSASNAVNATNVSQAFGSNNTAGNMIVVAVTWFGTGTVTCSDTRGNTYSTVRVELDSNNTRSLGVCYALNISAGANTVTGTFSGGLSSFRAISVSEFSGVATSGALDVHAGTGGGVGANPSSSSAIPTQDGDLIYGAVMDTSMVNNNDNSIAAGAGFTERGENDSLSPESQVQASASSIAAAWTFNTSSRYDAIMVAFKAASL